MDIKTRIDGLSEQTKIALAWAIYKAKNYESCFEYGECRKDDFRAYPDEWGDFKGDD